MNFISFSFFPGILTQYARFLGLEICVKGQYLVWKYEERWKRWNTLDIIPKTRSYLMNDPSLSVGCIIIV